MPLAMLVLIAASTFLLDISMISERLSVLVALFLTSFAIQVSSQRPPKRKKLLMFWIPTHLNTVGNCRPLAACQLFYAARLAGRLNDRNLRHNDRFVNYNGKTEWRWHSDCHSDQIHRAVLGFCMHLVQYCVWNADFSYGEFWRKYHACDIQTEQVFSPEGGRIFWKNVWSRQSQL